MQAPETMTKVMTDSETNQRISSALLAVLYTVYAS